MKHSIFKYIFFLLINTLSINAYSASVEPSEKNNTQLNQMAAQIMGWYGSLLLEQDNIFFKNKSTRLEKYKSHYPKNIQYLKIISSKFDDSEQDGKILFNITLNLNSSREIGEVDKNITQLKEQISFQEAQDGTLLITKVVLQEEKIVTAKSSGQITDRIFYKSREIAYSWLAYLDGSKAGDQFSKSTYQIQIGSVEILGSVDEALKERGTFLAKGEHVLRSIDIIQDAQSQNTFQLELVIYWKGYNAKGKPVIAKLSQTLIIKFNKEGRYEVISIDEKHLIPDLTPWQDLLC